MRITIDVYFKGFSCPVPMSAEQAFMVLTMDSLAPLILKMIPNVLLPEEEPKEN